MDKMEIGLNAGKVWQLLCNNEKWSYGSAMSDFRIYFGNFRIVPYTKPIIE